VGAILGDIKTVGDATGCQGAARALIDGLRARIDAVALRSGMVLMVQPPPRVVCLQSADPPIAAGWWLAELVGLAGGLDALGSVGRPPRAVTREQIDAAKPDLVIDLSIPPWGDREVFPGPGAVDLLEQLAAQILPPTPGLRSEARR
jgi:ABC-type Fe3+-hydroxamate transport system substrate-binding protein